MSNALRKKFFFQEGKKEYLVNFLTQDLDNLNYHLILVSCYFKLNSAKNLIESLLKVKNSIKEISIYIDRGSAIDIGKDDINKWINEIKNEFQLTINFRIVKSGNLFHPKAYCLLSNDHQNGRLVLGSANLTNRGLIEPSGNIEILYKIEDIKDIIDFYHSLNSDLNCIEVDEIEKFDDTDEYYFKYALLREGFYIKINDISSFYELLNFKYKFNDKKNQDTFNEILKKYEMKPSDKGIKNYFDSIKEEIINILKKYNSNYKIDWGRYGINTDFGYWIPKHVVSYLNDFTDETLENCKNELRKKFENHIDVEAKTDMAAAWNEFYQQKWLEKDMNYKITPEVAKSKLMILVDSCLEKLFYFLTRYYLVDLKKFDFNFSNLSENIDSVIFFVEPLVKKAWQISDEILEKIEQNVNNILSDNDNSIDEKQKYQKCIELFFCCKDLISIIVYIAVKNKDIRFLRYLDENLFRKYIEYQKKKQKSKKHN